MTRSNESYIIALIEIHAKACQMRKNRLFLFGLVLILIFFAMINPLCTAALGLIIGSTFLIYVVIYMLSGIAGYFEKEESQIKIAWAPEIYLSNSTDLIKAIVILGLSIAGLIILWTVVVHHPWLYPYLKDQGII